MYSSTTLLAEHRISKQRGFLPSTDPLDRLPQPFEEWENAAHGLPKLLMSDDVRKRLENLPPFPKHELQDDRQVRRAMVVLSYLGHAYVWGGERPATHLPPLLAVPWHEVATRLGRPPVLSYASYCLDNWYRFDPDREPELGNIGLIQNFLAGEDEEWFILIHVDIELAASQAVGALLDAQHAAADRDEAITLSGLQSIASSLRKMIVTLRRMPERCDPYMYYHRVRPFIHGWKNHPDLPNGLVYEGVAAYEGKPREFRGETGAQSAIIPSLDAVLGVYHGADELKSYLLEMRDYMPPDHRSFLERLEGKPSVRDFVLKEGGPDLRAAYDACVAGVEEFRSIHLEYAATYIFRQAQIDPKNPHAVGTGGTPFMRYLKKHRDETGEHRLPG